MSGQPDKKSGRISLPLLAAFGVVLALFAVFWFMLSQEGRNTSVVPSVLIGRAAPQTDLPPVEGLGLPAFTSDALGGKISIVNVWASWCGPCREEHPLLMALAQDPRIQIVGLNYKDKPDNAIGFLNQLGNPYDAVGADANGRTAINWGVYGVPETFLVNADGMIVYKHVGPLTAEMVREKLLPEIDALTN